LSSASFLCLFASSFFFRVLTVPQIFCPICDRNFSSRLNSRKRSMETTYIHAHYFPVNCFQFSFQI
jgi:hypothetical protein